MRFSCLMRYSHYIHFYKFPVMDNSALISKFYESFSRADVDGMVSCYHKDIQFEDPAFGKLYGDDARHMWRMLISSVKEPIQITFRDVQANENTGSAHWRAVYKFSQTGNTVINEINAAFEFKDGKIIKHTDTFDMWKWSRQALGLPGWLLGWSPFMKSKINQRTSGLLKAYKAKLK